MALALHRLQSLKTPAFAAAAVAAVVLRLLQKQQLQKALEYHQKLGPTVALTFPLSPWLVVTTRPENVEYILKTNFDNYPKGEVIHARFADLLGNGIFNADGKEWLHQRKTASKMFTANLFKEHIWAVVRRNARKLCSILESAGPGRQV